MKNATPHPQPRQPGFVLISVLVSTFFVMVAGVATASLAANNYRAAKLEQYRVGAQFAADAGIDHGMLEINGDHSWPGTAGEIELFNDGQTRTTYEASIVDTADPLVKYLEVTGRTYVPAGSSMPRVDRNYQVELRGISAGNFSVVTGVGGLTMTNSAKIIGGNLFVNGSINMSNTAQIGLASNPIDVKVANHICPQPADSDYPRKCVDNENDNPIQISNSAHIYGDVIANYQDDGGSMTSPGLDTFASAAGTVEPQDLPEHDRSAQIAAVSSTMTGAAASCTDNGTKTWPANLKIEGDVEISKKCRVTVQGDVWITGKLTMVQTGQLIPADGFVTHTDAPVVMIDGRNGLSASNSALLASNSSNVGFRVITYWSEAACSPDCAEVTGIDLYNTRDDTTISLANSSEGPNTEFYARWSRVTLDNGGNIGALVGQTVELSNSATVTFGAEVSGVGGVTGWVIESYKRDF